LVPQLRPCSRAGTSYTLPQILIGTVVLAFLFGIATTWWENYRVAKALASNSSFDEESPILRSRPPHTGAYGTTHLEENALPAQLQQLLKDKCGEIQTKTKKLDRQLSQRRSTSGGGPHQLSISHHDVVRIEMIEKITMNIA